VQVNGQEQTSKLDSLLSEIKTLQEQLVAVRKQLDVVREQEMNTSVRT
jgi:hypothetical protein